MSRKVRYDIKVYGRRGDQPCYSYFQYRGVKPSKVDRLLVDTCADIMAHESRGDFTATFYDGYGDRGFVIRVGICKFIVRKVRVYG